MVHLQQSAAADQIIPTADYPQLLPQSLRGSAMRMLRSSELLKHANSVIDTRKHELRRAVVKHIEQLNSTASAEDWNSVYWQAHEIRGLAGNADLTLAGRLSNLLCVYLDVLSETERLPDATVVTLHLDAIGRSIQAQEEALQLGDTVYTELSALVDRCVRSS